MVTSDPGASHQDTGQRLAMQAPEIHNLCSANHGGDIKTNGANYTRHGHISDVSVNVWVVSSEIQTAKMISSTQLN